MPRAHFAILTALLTPTALAAAASSAPLSWETVHAGEALVREGDAWVDPRLRVERGVTAPVSAAAAFDLANFSGHARLATPRPTRATRVGLEARDSRGPARIAALELSVLEPEAAAPREPDSAAAEAEWTAAIAAVEAGPLSRATPGTGSGMLSTPEPGTASLLLLGLFAFAYSRLGR